MINDLTTAVSNISPEELDKLFDTPAEGEENNGEDKKILKKDEEVKTGRSDSNVPFIEDIDDLFEKEKKEDKEEKKVEEKKEDKKVEDKEEDKEKKEEDKGKDDKKKKEEDKKEEIDTEQFSEVLTNTVNFLVSKGIFKDFEGREATKFTEELYAELVEKQLEAIVEERYDNKKKSAGEYGEAILDYLEKGGDADQIIDLFKEQKAVQDFDISDDESRKEIVVKWYKENHGWKSDKIKKYVDTLLAEEGALETEADDIKSKYDEHYKGQLAQLREQQVVYEKEQQRKQKAFATSITENIDKSKDFDDARKKTLKKGILEVKKAPDGSVVNDLFIKLAQMQSDPVSYIEFAEFVLDKEGYLKRKEIEFRNTAVDKKFKFVKGGAAIDKTKGSSHIEPDKNKDSDKYTGTDFRFALK